MQKQLISSGSRFETEIGYFRAVEVAGDGAFVSATTGIDYATMANSDDVNDRAAHRTSGKGGPVEVPDASALDHGYAPLKEELTTPLQIIYCACAIAFFKSRYSSHEKGQILSRLARCSLALSSWPIWT